MATLDSRSALQIQPGRGLGWITLGSSLYGILSRLKAQPQTYPSIDLSYSSSNPVTQPIILTLPTNGFRLRFDGPDQRLRLIEVLEFSSVNLTYKNSDLIRRAKASDEPLDNDTQNQGPTFRHIYNRLFGPAYAGEYVPPSKGHHTGIYVLSYPGLAFSFPVKHSSWSDKADFVSVLSSNATLPAVSMAIFSGSSWPEFRSVIYTKTPHLPRVAGLMSKEADISPDEIEEARIYGRGNVELVRRSSAPLLIRLGQTTPQDLIAELGPPDAIYRKRNNRVTVHATGHSSGRRRPSTLPAMEFNTADADHSSAQSHTEDSDIDTAPVHGQTDDGDTGECFYNYFQHGFDILISYPTKVSLPFPGQVEVGAEPSGSNLVITKIFLHSNVPGSYSFNRHRRSRWTIWTSQDPAQQPLTSEMPFSQISTSLKRLWKDTYENSEEEKRMQRGMVLNRGWGDSPESSIELLGGFEESPTSPQQTTRTAANSLPSLNNTELFGFEGLLFEVLKNDTICCLTVY